MISKFKFSNTDFEVFESYPCGEGHQMVGLYWFIAQPKIYSLEIYIVGCIYTIKKTMSLVRLLGNGIKIRT